MTDAELRRAIEQAWLHTYKTGARCGLREALEHLEALREEQRRRARSADAAEKYNDGLNDDHVGTASPKNATGRTEP